MGQQVEAAANVAQGMRRQKSLFQTRRQIVNSPVRAPQAAETRAEEAEERLFAAALKIQELRYLKAHKDKLP